MLDFGFRGPKPSAKVVQFFLLEEHFLGRGISQKAKREIYCLEVTKQSVMVIRSALPHCVLVVFGERSCQDAHYNVDEMVSHQLMQYLQINCLYLSSTGESGLIAEGSSIFRLQKQGNCILKGEELAKPSQGSLAFALCREFCPA